MEVTPKVFRDVQFREKLRGGYHPEDVDEFLEQAALGVEVLLDRLRQATERAQQAEQSAAEASAADEVLKRTLLVAQRTADQVVREAREEASRTLGDAHTRAEAMLAEATEAGRRAYEQSMAEGRTKLEAADATLSQAQQEADALRAWVDQHRAYLVGALRDAQALVETAGLSSEPPPITTRVVRGRLAAAGDAGRPSPVTAPGTVSDEWPFDEAEEAGPTGAHAMLSGGDDAGQEPATVPPGAVAPAEPAVEGTAQAGGEAKEGQEGAASGAPTMAVDERALDSFFSDQDLGDERRTGRLRHRH